MARGILMVQFVEQTRDEKIAMYMKMSKKALIDMLMTNQDLVGLAYSRPQRQPISTQITCGTQQTGWYGVGSKN